MSHRQYAPKPAQDTSVLSSEKLLQTRPFQPERNNNQHVPSRQASAQPMSSGWDLTKMEFVDELQRPQTSGPLLQAKLTIGEPNDKYEQEADRVAKQVVQRIHAPGGINATHSDQFQTASLMANPLHPLQRTAMREDEERLQKKAIANMQRFAAGAGTAPTKVEQGINSARGSGQSLAPKLQAQMGQAMGVDFSGVRVHADGRSDQLNRSIQAKAFTTGQDVFFRQGAYEPGNRGGQELLAHELTHVVQQNRGKPQNNTANVIQRKKTDGLSKAAKENLGFQLSINLLTDKLNEMVGRIMKHGHMHDNPAKGKTYFVPEVTARLLNLIEDTLATPDNVFPKSETRLLYIKDFRQEVGREEATGEVRTKVAVLVDLKNVAEEVDLSADLDEELAAVGLIVAYPIK